MSNYTTYPRQDAFDSSLLSDVDSSTLSITLNDSPSFTLSGANRCYGVIDYDNNLLEIVKIQSISGATLTLESRGVAKYEGGASTAVAHSAGAKFAISHDWINFSDIATAIATKADIAGQVFTGAVTFSGATNNGLVVNSLTTVQRDALSAPANGQIIYNTTEGEFQIYQGGAWSTMASGSTQPDASTTVAGKVEQAIASEIAASTEFGGTGAPLFISPTSVVKTSSGAGDENKLPVLNASGQMAAGFLDLTSKTDKSTLTTKGDIYAASGASTPIRLAVGTNKYILGANSATASGLEYSQLISMPNQNRSPYSSAILRGDFFTALTAATTIYGGLTKAAASVSPTQGYGVLNTAIVVPSSSTISTFFLEFDCVFDDASADVDFTFGICTSNGFDQAFDTLAGGQSCVGIAVDGSTNTMYTKVGPSGSITNTSMGAVTMATRYRIGIHYTTSTVLFYLDGALGATVTTNIPAINSGFGMGAGNVEVGATGNNHSYRMTNVIFTW